MPSKNKRGMSSTKTQMSTAMKKLSKSTSAKICYAISSNLCKNRAQKAIVCIHKDFMVTNSTWCNKLIPGYKLHLKRENDNKQTIFHRQEDSIITYTPK